MTILTIWLRALLLIAAVAILFGGVALVVDNWRWIRALGKSRVVRTDRQPMDFSHGVTLPRAYPGPENPQVRMGILPARQYDEIEARRLRLVVGGSSRSIH